MRNKEGGVEVKPQTERMGCNACGYGGEQPAVEISVSGNGYQWLSMSLCREHAVEMAHLVLALLINDRKAS